MTKKVPLFLFLGFSLIFLVYLVAPLPGSIYKFPALPDSTKSTLSGDTVQIPNISAYFSDNYRSFVIPFYSDAYKNQTLFPFGPLRLNYPPEHAFVAIKDQTQSTYLEELTYPFRDSLFVNGLEPFEENREPRYVGATKFVHGEREHLTKVTLRYYPSSVFARLLVWLGFVVSILMLWKMSIKVISNE